MGDNKLHIKAPAKINRFLHIVKQQADGYHQIQSLFQMIDWHDEIYLSATADHKLTLTGMDDLGGENLMLKAARLLQMHSGCKLGANIEIQKQLPVGAGLGGGSSNGACVLLGLNQLWQLNLSRSKLQTLGAALGADVPFFLGTPAAWVEGIGEQLIPVTMTQSETLILIYPNCAIATQDIFQHPKLERNHPRLKSPAPLDWLNPLEHTQNHCLKLVQSLYPNIQQLFEALARDFPDFKPQLTGTGSTVFIPADKEKSLVKKLLAYLTNNWPAYSVKVTNTCTSEQERPKVDIIYV